MNSIGYTVLEDRCQHFVQLLDRYRASTSLSQMVSVLDDMEGFCQSLYDVVSELNADLSHLNERFS